ncbi:MAG: DNA alkylation repair protein [Candidatus Omnitrophota bacterium]|jgi:3-methyladenine DNA glycosylase AlkD
MSLVEIKKKLKKYSSSKRAKNLQRFFKTAPGEYGHGDIFIGLTVPQIRIIAKEHKALKLNDTLRLLKSPIHEERLLSLVILVSKFKEGSGADKKQIYDSYLKNTKYINNWDLVDLTAHHIVGGFLKDSKRDKIYELVKSKDLWERRIAVLSTFHFIKNNSFKDTLRIAKILLNDKEDLIHKATGWMLREVAKRDKGLVENFLAAHHRYMPRTMLRYAIERFPEKERVVYLKKVL